MTWFSKPQPARAQDPLTPMLRCPQCPASVRVITGRGDSHWDLRCSNGHQFYGSTGYTITLTQIDTSS